MNSCYELNSKKIIDRRKIYFEDFLRYTQVDVKFKPFSDIWFKLVVCEYQKVYRKVSYRNQIKKIANMLIMICWRWRRRYSKIIIK